MIIRPIVMPDDTDMVLAGMKNFISRMDYTEFLPDSDDKLLAALHKLLNLGCFEVTLAEHEGRVVGGIGMVYAPSVWNDDLTAGEELFWWTDDDAPATTALRLIRDVQRRGREHGDVVWVFRSLTSSPDGVDRVYRRMGLRPVETVYMGLC